MKRFYKIVNNGNRNQSMLSINRVNNDGSHLYQEAYFFKGHISQARPSAEKRMAEMILEDAARGIESCVFESVTV